MASTEGFLVQACRAVGFHPRTVATTSDPLAKPVVDALIETAADFGETA